MKNEVEDLGMKILVVLFYQHWPRSENQSQVLNEAVLKDPAAWKLVFIRWLLQALVV